MPRARYNIEDDLFIHYTKNNPNPNMFLVHEFCHIVYVYHKIHFKLTEVKWSYKFNFHEIHIWQNYHYYCMEVSKNVCINYRSCWIPHFRAKTARSLRNNREIPLDHYFWITNKQHFLIPSNFASMGSIFKLYLYI